jgi:hypothetical protein
VQPFGPGLLMPIVFAVTAPVSSVEPTAAMQSPTASALDVALSTLA